MSSSGGNRGGVTLPVSIANGGTGQVTPAAALAALGGVAPAGVVDYNPAGLTSYTFQQGVTFVPTAADAANLAVPVTVGTSGKLLVELNALCQPCGANCLLYWAIMEGAAVLSDQQQMWYGTTAARLAARFLLTGLAPGAHTLRWAAWNSNNAVGANTVGFYAGGVAGGAAMTAWSLN